MALVSWRCNRSTFKHAGCPSPSWGTRILNGHWSHWSRKFIRKWGHVWLPEGNTLERSQKGMALDLSFFLLSSTPNCSSNWYAEWNMEFLQRQTVYPDVAQMICKKHAWKIEYIEWKLGRFNIWMLKIAQNEIGLRLQICSSRLQVSRWEDLPSIWKLVAKSPRQSMGAPNVFFFFLRLAEACKNITPHCHSKERWAKLWISFSCFDGLPPWTFHDIHTTNCDHNPTGCNQHVASIPLSAVALSARLSCRCCDGTTSNQMVNGAFA